MCVLLTPFTHHTTFPLLSAAVHASGSVRDTRLDLLPRVLLLAGSSISEVSYAVPEPLHDSPGLLADHSAAARNPNLSQFNPELS